MSAPDICGKNPKPLQLISVRLTMVTIAELSDIAAMSGRGFDEVMNELVNYALVNYAIYAMEFQRESMAN